MNARGDLFLVLFQIRMILHILYYVISISQASDQGAQFEFYTFLPEKQGY